MKLYIYFIIILLFFIIPKAKTETQKEIEKSSFSNMEIVNDKITIVYNGGIKKYNYDLTLDKEISDENLKLSSNSLIYTLNSNTFIIADIRHIHIIQNDVILKSFTINSYYNNYLTIAVISDTNFIFGQTQVNTYYTTYYLYSINQDENISSYKSFESFNIECVSITLNSSKYAICFFIYIDDFNVYYLIFDSSLTKSKTETNIPVPGEEDEDDQTLYLSITKLTDSQIMLTVLKYSNKLYGVIYEVSSSFELNKLSSDFLITDECYNGGQFFNVGKLNEKDLIVIYPSISNEPNEMYNFYINIYSYESGTFTLSETNKNIPITFEQNIFRFFKIIEVNNSEYAINYFFIDFETLDQFVYFDYLTLPNCEDFTLNNLGLNYEGQLSILSHITLDGSLLIHPKNNLDNIKIKIKTTDAPNIELYYDSVLHDENTLYDNLDKWTFKTGSTEGPNYIYYTVYNSLNYESKTCNITLDIRKKAYDENQTGPIDVNQIAIQVNLMVEDLANNAKNNTIYFGSFFSIQVYNTSTISQTIVANNNNLSEIYLNECETILRETYKIPENEVLIIIRIDVVREDTTSYQVEYEIYAENLTKLNLSYCKNEKIIIKSPHSISEDLLSKYILGEKYGYDIFNSNNSFYNNICTRFKSEFGSDVTINDRRKYYYVDELFCEENCLYISYNSSNMKVACECPTKTEISYKLNYHANYVKEQFHKNIKFTNIKSFGCFKIGFKHFGTNPSAFLLMFLIIGYAICIVFLFKQGYNELEQYLNECLFGANPPKQKKIIPDENKIINNNNNENNKKKERYQTENIKPLTLLDNKSLNEGDDVKSINSKKTILTIKPKNKTFDNPIQSASSLDEIVNNSNKKIENNNFSDDELSEMSFKLALLYDKRTFWKCYFSQIKFSHLIYFIFYNKSGFHVFLVKLLFGVFSISYLFLFNAFLYTDNNISHYFKNENKYDFGCEMLKIFLSSFICYFINMGIKFLILRRKEIQNFKEMKYHGNNSDLIKTQFNLYIKKYNLLLFIFAHVSIVIIFLIWLFLVNFGSVFYNSQKYYIIRIILSFFMIMIYPFIFNFINVFLRCYSLKKEKKLLYEISKILQYW